MIVSQFHNHLVEILDGEQRIALVRTLDGSNLGIRYQGGVGYVPSDTLLASADELTPPVQIGLDCDELVNWQAAIADVDALSDMDGLLPEMAAAIEFEKECARLFVEKVNSMITVAQGQPA